MEISQNNKMIDDSSEMQQQLETAQKYTSIITGKDLPEQLKYGKRSILIHPDQSLIYQTGDEIYLYIRENISTETGMLENGVDEIPKELPDIFQNSKPFGVILEHNYNRGEEFRDGDKFLQHIFTHAQDWVDVLVVREKSCEDIDGASNDRISQNDDITVYHLDLNQMMNSQIPSVQKVKIIANHHAYPSTGVMDRHIPLFQHQETYRNKFDTNPTSDSPMPDDILEIDIKFHYASYKCQMLIF